MHTHTKTIIFVTGVVMGIVVGESSLFASEIAIGAVMLGVIQAFVLRVESGSGKSEAFPAALITTIFCIGIFLGIVRVQLVEEKIPFACTSPCTFDARVVRSPELKNGYQEVVVRAHDVDDSTLHVAIRVPIYPSFHIGDELRISGTVREPNIIFPHGEKKLFDYQSFLYSKHIGSEMLYPKVEVINSATPTFASKLGRWKENMVVRMNSFVASPASSLASGMLFGNSSMSLELTETFRAAGLSHIIVLSGFNIAVVISFVLLVFAFLPLIFRIVLASLFVVMFVVMVGGEASVVRATLMAFIALLATLLGREYVARQALLISFLLIILYEPFSLLHDVSLHLSFLATAGIVYGSETVAPYVEKYIGEKWLALFTTTITAYVATVPYVMYTFGTVSLYALFANVLVLPLVPLAMLVSFVTIVSSYIWEGVALLFGFTDTALLDVIIFIAETVEGLPMSYIAFSISFVQMGLMYGAVGLLFAYMMRAKKVKDETRITNEQGYLTEVISY